MNEQPVNKHDFLNKLPAPGSESPLEEIRSLLEAGARKLIVLDDDPTGTQTVHDIPVITKWSVRHLARELQDPSPASYVLTNSRGLPAEEADALNREIGTNLREASRQTGRDFAVVSRSDSTLRGHFPNEVEALASGLEQSFRAWVLAPFFEAGGRLTVHDVHWVDEGEHLVPAASTPFAADAAFGYRSSNLREWVVEKTGGAIPPGKVHSVPLEDIREGGVDRVLAILRALPESSVCILNAVEQRDMEIAACALLKEESAGARFLYRTAASFVAARAGVAPRPLLTLGEMLGGRGRGGLVLVGSHVPKTTAQLEHFLRHRGPASLELNVRALLTDGEREAVIREAARRVDTALSAGRTAVVYTSRDVVGDGECGSLEVARRVSAAVVDVVRRIRARPRYLLAKGGITSSDVATEACGVERAVVLGQIVPGVPVWRCGPESRYPEMPLIVFPGNVGGPSAVTEAVERIEADRRV